jgi:hypothetical protein
MSLSIPNIGPRSMHPFRSRAPALVLAAALASPAAAQSAADSGAVHPGRALQTLVTVGGAAEEGLRDAQLVGRASDTGFLLRSPSSMTPRAGGVRVRVLAPELAATWNSRIPYSVDDGAMWAGRGTSAVAMAGVYAELGPVRLVLAPEVVYGENRGFDELLPVEWTAAQRLAYEAPWQVGMHSIDLPYRPGAGAVRQLRPGQSSLAVKARGVEAGAATESQWWGPAMRSGIVLSNQAAGIPHLFVRGAPHTPLGRVEAQWMVGALRDSRWFGTGGERAWRSLSAAAAVLHPRGVDGLSLGVARAVYAPAEDAPGVLGNAADVFTRWRGGADSLAARPFEQITSLFARMVLPGSGVEAYAEWARYRLPDSFRDLLEAPEHTQGFTFGGQWMLPAPGGRVRLGGEYTYLEKSPTYRSRSVGSWYAGTAVREGYTNEGQVIGAAVGPGGSGQWLAADWLHGGGRVGLVLGRVRWANDAFYDNLLTPRQVYQGHEVPRARYRGHDVTVLAGLRGALPLGPMRLDGEWTVGKRYNFLFQNYSIGWNTRDQAVDVVNHTLSFRLSPR